MKLQSEITRGIVDSTEDRNELFDLIVRLDDQLIRCLNREQSTEKHTQDFYTALERTQETRDLIMYTKSKLDSIM